MSFTDGASIPVWGETTARLPENPLTADAQADVCVVGAGISGLTAAWQLAGLGKKVVIIDAAAPGGGQTGRSTAHVTTAVDGRYVELEKIHGPEKMLLVAESLKSAITELERIVVEASIECAFERVDGYLVQDPEDRRPDYLTMEEEASRRAGLYDVELVENLPVAGFPAVKALKFPAQVQFDPLAYVQGLCQRLAGRGCRIHSQTRMTELRHGNGLWRVKTQEGHVISAPNVVMATNVPSNHRLAMHTKQAAYRSYAVGFQLPAGAMPKVQIWDTADPYHYARVKSSPDGTADILIVGGEDHRTGQADDAAERYHALERWTRQRFPAAGAVSHRWSGQILEPADGLPFIGRDPLSEGVYLVTGDSGQGTSHALIASMIIRDLIRGQPTPWASVYEPSRKMAKFDALREYALDQANVAAQYGDYFRAGDVRDESAILPGHGALVRHGLRLKAVHRDDSGQLHRRSAVCPHLGGIVAWNSGEKTWDCPCHGSRFAPCGHMLEGPSIAGLEQVT